MNKIKVEEIAVKEANLEESLNILKKLKLTLQYKQKLRKRSL